MCGRFASARKRMELLEEFGVQRDRVMESLRPDYNVAPTKPVYAVLTRRPKDPSESADGPAAGAKGEDAKGDDERPSEHAASGDGSAERGPSAAEPAEHGGVRELRVVRWGLVPFWAKDMSIGSRLINARAETVAEKPAFRRAFARHRCLIPADGFYEWEKTGDPAHPRKQPYYIHRADGGVLAFAGLYELWRDKKVPDDDPAAWVWTATIITTRAEDEVGRIHDRMPMVIDPSRWADWLDPTATSPEALHGLLAPAAAAAHLTSHPVSTEVNSVRHNGPGLIEPVTDAAEPAGTPPVASSRAGAGERGGASPSAPGTLF